MSSNVMGLKAQIRNLAKESGVSAQSLLQNFMFERFLDRLSQSEFKEKFIIKGGVLVAAIVGLDTRSTMDLDTTIRGIPLAEDSIRTALQTIIAVKTADDVCFTVSKLQPIRHDDEYGGYRASLTAKYETIEVPLSIDITVGDVITPNPVPFFIRTMFDKDRQIPLLAYNIETVLAEKIETILRRNIFTTRPRDFYDIYVLHREAVVDPILLQEAIAATAAHRGSSIQIADRGSIIKTIETDARLQTMWEKYRRQFAYARDVEYEDVIIALKVLCQETLQDKASKNKE